MYYICIVISNGVDSLNFKKMELNVIKKSLSDITFEIQEAYDNRDYDKMKELIKSSSSFEKHYNLCVEKFKELQGTDKQINWAKKIREEKTISFVYQKCLEIWDRDCIKRGEKGLGLGFSNHDLKIKKLSEDFKFIFSNKASIIIENK